MGNGKSKIGRFIEHKRKAKYAGKKANFVKAYRSPIHYNTVLCKSAVDEKRGNRQLQMYLSKLFASVLVSLTQFNY